MNFYTVATLIPRKNIVKTIFSIILLNLFFNKKHTFTIYGDGPLKPIVKLLSYIFGSIIYKGYINNEVLLNNIAHFDAFLLFSKREAFGLVYIEALSEKIPVGCLKDEGISDIIEEYDLGAVSLSCSIKDICLTISKLKDYKINKLKLSAALNEFKKENVLNIYLNK